MSTHKAPPFWNRRFIISPVQLKLVALMAVMPIFSAALIILMIAIIRRYGADESGPYLLPGFVFCSVAFSSCCSILLCSFTNRISGPLFRLHSEIKKRLAGEVREPIRFRPNAGPMLLNFR